MNTDTLQKYMGSGNDPKWPKMAKNTQKNAKVKENNVEIFSIILNLIV